MFLIPGLAALFAFIYLRPQEVFDLLRPVTVGAVLSVAALAYFLDLQVGVSRPRRSPVIAALVALFVLSAITVLLKAPARLTEQMAVLGASVLGFLFVALGVQSLRGVASVAAVLLAITLTISAIGVHQGLAPTVCFQRGTDTNTTAGEAFDGRPCTEADQCLEGGAPGAEYLCERAGLMGTHTIGGRVRFRGLLEDPNELCMAISMGLPLAFAFFERRRSASRLALVLLTLAVGLTCVIMTKSRSGQLAVLAALGVYFARRFGKRGVVLAVLVSIPLLLLGGRSGAEADSSSEERLECWAEAIDMWRANPFFGVGQGQFPEYHYLTAHNSFLLALAELGPLGLMLLTTALYAAIKITVRAQIDLSGRPEATDARIWATTLLASQAGLLVSVFFLSVAYHTIVWMFLGLPVAFYNAVRAHDPSWRVRFALRDLLLVIAIDIGMVSAMALYLRLKGI